MRYTYGITYTSKGKAQEDKRAATPLQVELIEEMAERRSKAAEAKRVGDQMRDVLLDSVQGQRNFALVHHDRVMATIVSSNASDVFHYLLFIATPEFQAALARDPELHRVFDEHHERHAPSTMVHGPEKPLDTKIARLLAGIPELATAG